MNGEEAKEVIQQLRQEIAELRDQQRLYEKTMQEKEELKAALLKAESDLQDANAKVKELELRPQTCNSCLANKGSREDMGVQEPPRSAGGDLPAAGSPSKRPSEASQEEPPRERVTERDVDAISKDQKAAEMHPQERGALHLAAERGDARALRDLLDRGFDPCVRDHAGKTPLHIALSEGKIEAAEVLMEADGGNDIEDLFFMTPLHWAAAVGYVEIVRRLVSAGAMLRHQDFYGRTALHCALYNGKRAVAQLLIELDDRENSIPDIDGNTPLHIAAKKGFAGIVKGLLSGGACPHSKNSRGQYPLYLAARGGHDDIVQMILAVYAWRGIEVNEVEVFRSSRLSSLDPHRIQHCRDLSDCEAEIRRMKETRVAGSTISYYDFATRPVSGAAMYLRNEGIGEELLGDRVALDFPIYADLIVQRVGRAEEKRVLIEECLECFSVLFRKFPPLPEACLEIVLRCLTERDMKSVVKSVKFC